MLPDELFWLITSWEGDAKITQKFLPKKETKAYNHLYYQEGNYMQQEGRSVNARLYIAAFSHFLKTSIIFHIFRYLMPLPVHPPNLISYFNPDILAPIIKLYSLHQSALVEDQDDIQILSLYCFVLEEFNDNIANYIRKKFVYLFLTFQLYK